MVLYLAVCALPCLLSLLPVQFAMPVLFVVACFVSTAMGTSVGTITLITPIAVEVAVACGFDFDCSDGPWK